MPEEGALMHLPLKVNTDPNRKRPTLHLWQEVTLRPAGGSKIFLPARQQPSQ